jgi:methyltransferase (TIGR00027 family)
MKPISKTAFYCAGVRMVDAEQPRPICGDTYAKVFMTEEGLKLFEPFRDQTYPNASNVARHRIIDDLLRSRLERDPGQRVVLIGAGFDSRAFRLTGGRWVELDEPQVIAFKQERLPAAGAPNPLQRIGLDFATESLADALTPFRGERATVVVEGVLVYLTAEQTMTLAETLRTTFPSHTLIVDLMTRTFFNRYAKAMQEKLRGLGATLLAGGDQPELPFLAAGYRLVQRSSLPGRAAELGAIKLPRILQWTVLRSLVKGYQLHVFESTGNGGTA